MDLDSNADESEASFPVIKGAELKNWRAFLKGRYQIGQADIHAFGDNGLDLDFTIITTPVLYPFIFSRRYNHNKDGILSNSSAYIVSSKLLAKWFPSWRGILLGVRQSIPQGSIGFTHLAMDDLNLFRLFLGLAHNCEVDFDCSLDKLIEVAHYIKRHRLEALVAPRIRDWVKTARDCDPVIQEPYDYANDWEWLVIGYEYGLKDVFHRASLRLAYWVQHDELQEYILGNRPGFTEFCKRLLYCRRAFIVYAIRDLIGHYERVIQILTNDVPTESEICINGMHQCIMDQSWIIYFWLSQNGIACDQNHLPTYEHFDEEFSQSPCGLFVENDPDMSDLCEECRERGLLRRIFSELKNNIGTILGQFLTSSPDNCPMTSEHVAYMAERRRVFESAVPRLNAK